MGNTRDLETYETCTMFSPSLTSCGRSLTSLRFDAGRITLLTPARTEREHQHLSHPKGVNLVLTSSNQFLLDASDG